MRPLLAAALVVLLVRPDAAAPAAAAPSASARVLEVEDGHMLRVQMGRWERRVRLACVDAPEPSQQPWARDAAGALSRLVPPGSTVTVELRARDVYDRIVAVVRNQQGDVAPGLLQQGLLFAFDGYLGRCDDLAYKQAEALAREKQRGVWAEPGGIERPWDIREKQGDRRSEP
jgi:endonuclease YncB( thermonuclease family)